MVHGFGETPLIDQLKYLDVATGLCGPTSLCMLVSAAMGRYDNPYTPDELFKDFPWITKYRDSYGGFGDGIFKDKELMEKLNLKLENENGNPYYEGKAWTDGLLMDALEEGKRAIWCTQNKLFTDSGHYIELELKDGKIWLNDPNGENYQSMNPTLRNILDNGCTPEEFKKYGGRFYIFDVANSEGTGKTSTQEKSNEVLMNEILEKGSTITPTKPTNQTRISTRTEAILQTRTVTRTTIQTRTSTRTNTPTRTTQKEKDITNLQPKNNRDIAHRGYTPGGIYDNSAEAFIMAGEKGFWGCETDVRFDANGNLVCSHNAVKNGQNPTSFEEYLDICKKYGMTAIIDLKYEKGVGPADPNLSPAILKTIQEKGMMDSCILQTNNPTDIPYIRKNSENARVWYLTDVISDNNLKLIEENNVECVNILTSENNSNRIKKLTENGIDVCVWNVQSETSKQRVLDMGAKYVMSDNVLGITPYQEGEKDFNDVKGKLENQTVEGVGIDTKPNTEPQTRTQTRTNTRTNTRTTITTTRTTTESQSKDTDATTINPKWDSGYLTAPQGYIKYEGKDGRLTKETWCDLDTTQLVINMHERRI